MQKSIHYFFSFLDEIIYHTFNRPIKTIIFLLYIEFELDIFVKIFFYVNPRAGRRGCCLYECVSPPLPPHAPWRGFARPDACRGPIVRASVAADSTMGVLSTRPCCWGGLCVCPGMAGGLACDAVPCVCVCVGWWWNHSLATRFCVVWLPAAVVDRRACCLDAQRGRRRPLTS